MTRFIGRYTRAAGFDSEVGFMPADLAGQLPERFGRYRILKLLGRGGMGAVYLARDTQLDRDVALKVPRFDANAEANALSRFQQEARSAATLHHPNICPVFDVGAIDGVHFLTMAFIEGKPLEQWIRAGKPLTPRQIAALVRKLALALHEAHRKGVIHRDLKPANIMMDRRAEPVIMDFGLARRCQGGDARLTQAGALMGTPAYMAPEQVSGDLDAMGPACDIYSLGMILYELLAGRTPFTGDVMAILTRVLLEEPPRPSAFRPGVDPELERICMRALAKKPADRFASMADFAAALTDYLRAGGTPQPAPAPAGLPAVPQAAADAETLPQQSPAVVARPAGPPVARAVRATAAEARPRRRTDRPRGLPTWWLVAAAGAAGVVLVLVGLAGVVIYRATDYGTIRIVPSEPDADVTIRVDYADAGPPDTPLRLAVGEHDLEVTSKEYDTVHYPIHVFRGDNDPHVVKLQSRFGNIRLLLSNPDAEVDIKIDGKGGHRHGELLHLWPREYQLDVTGKGYQPVHKAFTVIRGDNPPLQVQVHKLGSLGSLPRLAFAVQRSEKGGIGIFLLHPGRGDPVDLTPDAAWSEQPAWSPDGKAIAFASRRTFDTADLFLLDPATKNLRQLTGLTGKQGNNTWPAWSPKGDRIAFNSDRGGKVQVYVMNADGSDPVRLTKQPVPERDPAWSPDGKQIAFAVDGKGGWGIYLADVAGKLPPKEVHHIGQGPVAGYSPAWAPDGRKLAFAAPAAGKADLQIHVLDLDHNTTKPFTNLQGDSTNPAWAPDGAMIAFRHAGEKEVLYVMRADGTGPLRELAAGKSIGRMSWEPPPP
jgi:predicted Ser/Thr protein kinase